MTAIVVQKFGGSSLATAELREIAASRVLAVRQSGKFPVVVCSAIGRTPDPYATDTLAKLVEPARGGPNRDVLIACGETIACAVFAELLTSLGAAAQAVTGGQAGFVSDETWGDAKIVTIDPTHVLRLIDNGVIPVVTGFQATSVNGATTTLGRGGSDLTAIALGDALKADAVEIYTDVSGVMTADPRRIEGAHTVERVRHIDAVSREGTSLECRHHDRRRCADRSRAARYGDHLSARRHVLSDHSR
jgi:aspartate kinase